VQKYIEGDRKAVVSLHLYRVPVILLVYKQWATRDRYGKMVYQTLASENVKKCCEYNRIYDKQAKLRSTYKDIKSVKRCRRKCVTL